MYIDYLICILFAYAFGTSDCDFGAEAETAHRRVLAGKDKQGRVTRISLPRRSYVDSAL